VAGGLRWRCPELQVASHAEPQLDESAEPSQL